MKTLKKGRYYVFGNETDAWYLNTSGEWNSIASWEDYVPPGPWGLDNPDDILDKIKTIIEYDPNYSVECYTVKEYEKMMFLMNL